MEDETEKVVKAQKEAQSAAEIADRANKSSSLNKSILNRSQACDVAKSDTNLAKQSGVSNNTQHNVMYRCVALLRRVVALIRRATFSSFRTTKFFTMLIFARVWERFFGMSKKSLL